MYIIPFLYSPFQTKTGAVYYTHPSFVRPRVVNRGPACWLFKDNSKLLFLLIKWLCKRVKIKHLLNIDHTSHFVTTFFFFFLHCLLVFFTVHTFFFCLWIFFICTSQSWQKFYTIFSYRVVFQCELMTVFVIVAGRASLVVVCWKLACVLCFLSLCWVESTWMLLYSIQSLWLTRSLKSGSGWWEEVDGGLRGSTD